MSVVATDQNIASDPLVSTTSIASTPARARKFILQSLARELLPRERIGVCMRMIQSVGVDHPSCRVVYSPSQKKAHYSGLIVCGSIWSCPVCASKITERRRVELAKAIAGWPGSVFMATFTLQHTREDKLLELRDYLKSAFRKLKSGRWWQGFETSHSIAGSIAAFEVTVSIANGWHPHLHVLFFSQLAAGQVDYLAAENGLQERFKAVLAREGRYVSSIYGVRVEKPVEASTEGDSALKKYVSKWGLDAELTKSPVKNAREENGVIHYSPFQLLMLYATGQKWAGALFREYALTMKGSKQLNPSRGLRELLGMGQEHTDEELAEEPTEMGDIILARLVWYQWRLVLAYDARAELLAAADSGDREKVREFLHQLGIYIGTGLVNHVPSEGT